MSDADLERWKHFAGMGGADKNTMITTETLLLGFASATMGYLVTQMIPADTPSLPHPIRMMAVSALGLTISALAAYVALLYGGYSNRNWAEADRIEGDNPHWRDSAQGNAPAGTAPDGKGVAGFAWSLAQPCDPKTKLAPVFWVFFVLGMSSVVLHSCFLGWAIYVSVRSTSSYSSTLDEGFRSIPAAVMPEAPR